MNVTLKYAIPLTRAHYSFYHQLDPGHDLKADYPHYTGAVAFAPSASHEYIFAPPTKSSKSIQFVANIPYFISDAEAGPVFIAGGGLVFDADDGSAFDAGAAGPCTLIPYTGAVTTISIRQTVAAFTKDDVWSPEFLSTVVFEGSPDNAKPAADILHLLDSLGTANIRFSHGHLQGGPYWLEGQKLHKVSRLYDDDAGAFVMATAPNRDAHFGYHILGFAIHTESQPSLSVAVRSRLYYKRTATLPLAGLRIAVKDNTDLQGVRTGGSPQAYTRLYGPCKEHCSCGEAALGAGCRSGGEDEDDAIRRHRMAYH